MEYIFRLRDNGSSMIRWKMAGFGAFKIFGHTHIHVSKMLAVHHHISWPRTNTFFLFRWTTFLLSDTTGATQARPISLRKVAWPIWIICDPFLDFLILRRSAPVGLSVPGAHCLCVVKRPNGRNQVEVGFGDCDHLQMRLGVQLAPALVLSSLTALFRICFTRWLCQCCMILKDQETFQTCSLSWKASLRWDPT